MERADFDYKNEEEVSNKVDYSSLRRQAFQVTYSMSSKLLPADDGILQNKNSALTKMSVLIHQKFFCSYFFHKSTSFIKIKYFFNSVHNYLPNNTLISYYAYGFINL